MRTEALKQEEVEDEEQEEGPLVVVVPGDQGICEKQGGWPSR